MFNQINKQDSSQSFQNQNLKVVFNCPICGQSYDATSMKLIEESEEAHLLHIVCQNCGTQILALVMINSPKISSHGMITDLTSREVKKFKDSKKVKVDDVIDLNFALNNKDFSILEKI
ncbi:MAG: hypothetical protein U5L76_02775 [Patescibacteria group bacterium]|nr:hypothetical protein [Patescibacteria group bacterium]